MRKIKEKEEPVIVTPSGIKLSVLGQLLFPKAYQLKVVGKPNPEAKPGQVKLIKHCPGNW